MSDFTSEEICHVVTKLAGGMYPIGESNYDRKCLENLGTYKELINYLIEEIIDLLPFRNRHEASMRDVGERAYEFCRELKEWMDTWIESGCEGCEYDGYDREPKCAYCSRLFNDQYKPKEEE